MFISIGRINQSNIGIKFITDFLVTLFVPLVLMIVYRKRLIEFKLQFKNSFLQYALIGTMIFLFVLHKDFTIAGCYRFFFYLIVVSFSEEFVFRGYVYNQLLRHNKWLAIIVSGFFWGISHAILPGLLDGDGLGQIGIRMLSEIGGGIIAGYYFIYLLNKSNSLFIPIFIHAILDYQVGNIGTLIAIVTGAYFIIIDRRVRKSIFYKEDLD